MHQSVRTHKLHTLLWCFNISAINVPLYQHANFCWFWNPDHSQHLIPVHPRGGVTKLQEQRCLKFKGFPLFHLIIATKMTKSKKQYVSLCVWAWVKIKIHTVLKWYAVKALRARQRDGKSVTLIVAPHRPECTDMMQTQIDSSWVYVTIWKGKKELLFHIWQHVYNKELLHHSSGVRPES